MSEIVNENPDTGNIKQLPYGVTDYGLVRNENYYYIDKTAFIPRLERAGRYLFFIRPRRFGKSLFISLLKTYYDVAYKDRFEEFFKGTWIYEHPTKERGEYLVLAFNFSGVNPDPTSNNEAFLSHIQYCVVDFTQKYEKYLSANPEKEFFIQKIKSSHIASDVLSGLFYLCAGAHQKLYVFIDEYDNFANTILPDVGSGAYHKLTHGIGQFRAFFNVLKEGTTGTEAPVTRSFISGVSPITMDDVTSGYNIGENVSLDANFNSMLGFTAEDVSRLIEYYCSKGLIKDQPLLLTELFSRWYGNYLFSENTEERIYNPDMVLYFLKEYFKTQSLPKELVDYNVKIDYNKLRHLVIVDKENKNRLTTNGNFEKLKEIIEKGSTMTKLVRSFPLSVLGDAINFKSLLFYLGLLTIKAPYHDQLLLEIPNESVKHLYFDYIENIYRETGIFAMDMGSYAELMTALAYDGKWKPLFEFITGLMKYSISLRDLITGEKAVQAFLNVYLGLSSLYIIHPEREANKGYADILMEPFLARYTDIKYSYLIEIKYIKRAAGKKPADREIKKLVTEAEKQLQQYSLDEKLAKTQGKTTLIQLVLVFCGHEAVYIGEGARAPRL